MCGRTLGHVGGLLGLAAIAAGVTLGARAGLEDAAAGRPVLSTEETQALESADERPAFVIPARARPADRPRAGPGADAVGDDVAGRTWSVRVLGPDERPMADVPVSVQFQRSGNTSYLHDVGERQAARSDVDGRAAFRVPDRARFASVSARPPEGWFAPPEVRTGGVDTLAVALRRARLARSASARRAPRADVARDDGEPLGTVTLRLVRASPVSGRVDVPAGFPARRVVATAFWRCPVDDAFRSRSTFCESDGTFLLPVPEGAGLLDVQALVSEDEHEAGPWRSVPDGPAAVVGLGPPPMDPPPPAPDGPDAVEEANPGIGRADLVPALVRGVAPGTFGLRLRLVAACTARLEVLDAAGHAACAGRVDVVDAEGRCGRALLSGPHFGRYTLEGLAAGSYEFVLSGEAGVTRRAVQLPVDAPLVFRLVPDFVSGRLEGASAPDDWWVIWRPDDPTSPDATARVEHDGTFRVRAEAGARGRIVAATHVASEEHAGWAASGGVVAGRTDVVLRVQPGRALAGCVLDLPRLDYWNYEVRWAHPLHERGATVEEDGTFRLVGLPEGVAPLELLRGSDVVARWSPVAAGSADLRLRFPSADDPPDAAGSVAEVGLTPEPDGR